MNIKYVSLVLITAIINLYGRESSPYRCKMSGNNLEADIIVIGGGTAGCILMNQLSENGQFSVLGLEAGQNVTTNPAIQAVGLPAYQLDETGKSQYFWSGETLPITGLNGRTNDWTTGEVLGGASSVSGLYYGRGSNAVYSLWEGISGSSNWSLANILATFQALENYQGLTITPGERGTSGPVSVLQTPTVSNTTLTVLLLAAEGAFPEFPLVVDYNDPSVENCIDTRAQWFIDSSGTQRVSSATAFLNNTVMTPDGQGVNGHKLFLLYDAVAVKIIFDKHGNAKGVRYIQGGKTFEAHAKKAVVLAGGINNSKLLQLSGIGPSAALNNAGIKPVFINESVGKNLQNHPLISISLLADPSLIGIPSGAPYAYTILNVYLPVVGGSSSDPRALQILFDYIPASGQNPSPIVTLGLKLLNPLSVGSVTIQSDNSFQIAAADDGFYQNPVDLDNMNNAVISYIKTLLDQLAIVYPSPPYFHPVVGDPINPVILSGYSPTVVEQYVKNNTNLSLNTYDFTSHCKMAPLSAGGVVDGNTRVYGTNNVFIADNSICPVIPDIDSEAAAMMIGLRSSQILKQVIKK